MTYVSTKTYGAEVGLSCAFRQWKAQSHCRFIHGYALTVRIEFEAEELDARGWVIDSGGLKEIKQYLTDTFDHKLLVAEDDPMLEHFAELVYVDAADVQRVPATGCEAFAELIWRKVESWLFVTDQNQRVRCRSVEVREHGANSAIYEMPAKGIPLKADDFRVAHELMSKS